MELRFYFSPYCPYCRASSREAERAVAELGLPGTIEYCSVVDHLDAAVAIGMRTSPALAYNGRLVASGRLQAHDLVRRLKQIMKSSEDE